MGCTVSEDTTCSTHKKELVKKSNEIEKDPQLNDSDKKYNNEVSEEDGVLVNNDKKDYNEELNAIKSNDELHKDQDSKEIQIVPVIDTQQTLKIKNEESKSECNDVKCKNSNDPKEVLLALGYDLQTDYDDDDSKRQNPVGQLVIPYTDEYIDKLYKQSTVEGDYSSKK